MRIVQNQWGLALSVIVEANRRQEAHTNDRIIKTTQVFHAIKNKF